MFAIVHLATGNQVNYTDEESRLFEDTGYNPNEPASKPRLFFKSQMQAALFIETNKFVLADDETPLVGLPDVSYDKRYIIPKHQLEIIEF